MFQPTKHYGTTSVRGPAGETFSCAMVKMGCDYGMVAQPFLVGGSVFKTDVRR